MRLIHIKWRIEIALARKYLRTKGRSNIEKKQRSNTNLDSTKVMTMYIYIAGVLDKMCSERLLYDILRESKGSAIRKYTSKTCLQWN